MKKTIKFVLSILSIIGIICTMVISPFAAEVENTYMDLYSGTVGDGRYLTYICGDYYGYFYSMGSQDNTLNLRGECKGGPKADYYTTFYMFTYDRPSGRTTISKNSESENDNCMSGYIVLPSKDLIPQVNGYVETITTNKTDSSDEWMYNLLRFWVGQQCGWGSCDPD